MLRILCARGSIDLCSADIHKHRNRTTRKDQAFCNYAIHILVEAFGSFPGARTLGPAYVENFELQYCPDYHKYPIIIIILISANLGSRKAHVRHFDVLLRESTRPVQSSWTICYCPALRPRPSTFC